ncbi:hypothetical protein [Nocardia wallacei]|uniref:hypothetical protein n=1 Tax=Nocardia wallacei TaxID=480035 RepID=UPI0024553EB7|nr:hypothetical protein [Nocardia wallacei]
MSAVPTLEELLAAMQGDYDPQHPRADILRAAWLLAQRPVWHRPGDALAVRIRDGTVQHTETGTQALEALDVNLQLAVTDALIDRIAAAVGGRIDSAAQEYAMAIHEVAHFRAGVIEAKVWFGECRDSEAVALFEKACRDYEAARDIGHVEQPGPTLTVVRSQV